MSISFSIFLIYCTISFFIKTLSRQQHFVIFRFFLTSSHRQPFAHAQYPISHHPIRILRHPRQSPGAGDQIDFQFLSIKIRIIPPHDPPFHQKRTGSGDKGSGKGCSGDRGIASTGSDCHDIHPQCSDHRLDIPRCLGKAVAGKGCIRLG